jgi:putative flippase GtrA
MSNTGDTLQTDAGGPISSLLTEARYRNLRYLLAAGWNTLFGYFTGVGLYFALSQFFHVTIIGLIGNFVSISMSFVVYKLFVFRTKGRWFIEYVRSNIVYGSSAIMGIGLLWLLVDYARLSIWIAQFLIIAVTALISFFGHRGFTFKR